MKKLAIGLIAAVLSTAALAEPLDTKRVAGDAKWLAHLDCTALIQSNIGQLALAEAEKNREKDLKEKIAQCQDTCGFHPLKDLRGVTLYGPECGSETGVAVVDITVDRDKVLAMLRESEDYRQLTYGRHTLHQWRDQRGGRNKLNTGCFYDDNTIVISDSVKLLKAAIDVLDGRSDSLATTKSMPVLPKPARGSFVICAARDFAAAIKPSQPAVLKNLFAVAIQAGEADERAFVEVVATLKDAEQATRIRQVAQGFIALAGMLKEQERFEDLRNLGEEVLIGGTGTSIDIHATIPTKTLVEAIKRFHKTHPRRPRAAEAQ